MGDVTISNYAGIAALWSPWPIRPGQAIRPTSTGHSTSARSARNDNYEQNLHLRFSASTMAWSLDQKKFSFPMVSTNPPRFMMSYALS
jgi:hypothetical protein